MIQRQSYLWAIGKLKLEPLKQWHCDKRNDVIDRVEDRWLKWLKKINDDKEYKFRIVNHSKKCMLLLEECTRMDS